MVSLNVNGLSVEANATPDTPLLSMVLRLSGSPESRADRVAVALSLRGRVAVRLEVSPDWRGRRPVRGAIRGCAAVAPERYSNPRDPARNTASVRVLTASLEKMRLTCDFTVSGEISRTRAMCLLVKP
jgi:hypothetical protein